MKKVNVFKTTFPNGETHYGVSEQAHTIKSYLRKTKSIAINNKKNGLNVSKFITNCVEFADELLIEIIRTFDVSKEAREFRDISIKSDTNSINRLAFNVSCRLESDFTALTLPMKFSKSLTNKEGKRLYYVNLAYATTKGFLDRLNINESFPTDNSMKLINPNSYRIERV
jgi:hypothetical protein